MTLKSRLGIIQGHWEWHRGYGFIFAFHITMALTCVIWETHLKRDILVENREFFSYPLAFDAPVSGVPVGILP